MTSVAGVDCSTQSTKVVVCDAETGEVVREGRAPHPDVTEVDAAGLVAGLGGGLGGPPRRRRGASPSAASSTAWCWSTRPAPRCATHCCGTTTARRPRPPALIEELGGPQAWADRDGQRAGRQLHGHQAALGRRARAGRRRAGAGRAAPPRLDHPPAARRGRRADHRPRRRVRHRLLVGRRRTTTVPTCCGRRSVASSRVPRVAGPREPVGETPDGIGLAPGTGDNMGAALGPRARARRRGRVARHQRHGVRGRPTGRPPTRRASSPGSPTRPAGSCRWCAP